MVPLGDMGDQPHGAFALPSAYTRVLDTKTPLKSLEQEVELHQRYTSGDMSARDELLYRNQRFVIHVAKRYARFNSHINIEDLIAEGNLGLLKAIERYDPKRGIRFITYASTWIRASIRMYVKDHGKQIRTTTTTKKRKLFNSLAREKQQIEAILQGKGKNPAHFQDEVYAELAKLFEISAEKIRAFEVAQYAYTSVETITQGFDTDQYLKSGMRVMISEDPRDEMDKQMDKTYLAKSILELLGNLDDRERDIIKRRFNIGFDPRYHDEETLKEIGDSYNLSRERIRQIETIAKRKLRTMLKHKIGTKSLEKLVG